MIDFYNAFISYKHADLDSSIAEHIQNRLEHFHVPRKIGKKLKHEKISRIFRDKDELPATSNLTETITDALEKAEHLIVICSTNTKKSIWVQREIETFLKTHSIDKILTVLCDGEPNDVIPEILLFREQELKDENGVLRKVKIPMEPLSCDYRLGKKQADKEELARLASAILGCSYDELQRRRRQYKIRRAITVGSVVVAGLMAFGGYMIYANKKINESLNEALRNRSKYLANEAERLLEDDLRTDALQIAIEAAPKDLDDKSLLIPKAERALIDATGAYLTYGSVLTNTWNFKSNSRIDAFAVSPEGRYVAVKDASGHVSCWNRVSKEIFFEKNDGNGIFKILNPEGEYIFVYQNKLEAYSTQDGKKIWTKEFEEKSTSLRKDDINLQGDKIYYEIKGTIFVLSAKDGKEIAKYDLNKWALGKFVVSSSGDKIAYDYTELGQFNDVGVNLCDVNTGEKSQLLIEDRHLYSIAFAGDYLFTVTGDQISAERDILYDLEAHITKPTTNKITCFDMSLQEKWSAEITYDSIGLLNTLLYLPERNAIACDAGNVVCIYDIASGAVLNEYTLSSAVRELCDPDADGIPMIITFDGTVYFPRGHKAKTEENGEDKPDNSLISRKLLCDEIVSAGVYGGIFCYSKYDKDLHLYEYNLVDDEWTFVPETDILKNHSQSLLYNDDILFLSSESDTLKDGSQIVAIDPNKGSVMYTKNIDDGYSSYTSAFGRFGDSFYYFGTKKLYKIDPKTGDNTTIDLKDLNKYSETIMTEGCFIYFDKPGGEAKRKLYVVNFKDDSLMEFETDLEKNDRVDRAYYNETLNSVFFESSKKIYIAGLNGKDKKAREIEMPDSWNPDNLLFFVNTNEDGSLVFFGQNSNITVTDKSFKDKYSINIEGISPVGLTVHKKKVFLLSSDYLSIFDEKNGDLLKRCEISISAEQDDTLYGDIASDITFDEDSKLVFIKCKGSLVVLDGDTMSETAHIDNCYGYHKGTDRFYTFKQDEGLGYFKHYSVEDLVKKAEKILNGQPIPPEYKEKYGIE